MSWVALAHGRAAKGESQAEAQVSRTFLSLCLQVFALSLSFSAMWTQTGQQIPPGPYKLCAELHPSEKHSPLHFELSAIT